MVFQCHLCQLGKGFKSFGDFEAHTIEKHPNWKDLVTNPDTYLRKPEKIDELILDLRKQISISFAPNGEKKNIKILHGACAELFSSVLKFKHYKKTLYFYNEELGSWEIEAEEKIQELMRKAFPEIKNNIIDETIAAIKQSNRSFIFEQKKNLINFINGVYDIDKKSLLPHSCEYNFLYCIRTPYDKDARYPEKVMNFLKEITENDDEKIIKILEAFAYILVPGYPIHKAFMFYGSGFNGKGTTLKLLKKLIGVPELISALTLQQMTDRPFSVSNLIGKVVNISSDMPSKTIIDTGVFKGLLGEDLTYADRKFKDMIGFDNSAKLFFQANKIPLTWDTSEAYYGRWIIIDFSRVFEEAAEGRQKINDMLEDEKEIKGLLKLLIEKFLPKLLQNQKFTYTDSTEETARKYNLRSNPAQAFIEEECILEPEGETSKEALWNALTAYCKKKLISVPSQKQLSETVLRLGVWSRKRTLNKGTPDEERRNVWVGLKLKDLDDFEEEIKTSKKEANLEDYLKR